MDLCRPARPPTIVFCGGPRQMSDPPGRMYGETELRADECPRPPNGCPSFDLGVPTGATTLAACRPGVSRPGPPRGGASAPCADHSAARLPACDRSSPTDGRLSNRRRARRYRRTWIGTDPADAPLRPASSSSLDGGDEAMGGSSQSRGHEALAVRTNFVAANRPGGDVTPESCYAASGPGVQAASLLAGRSLPIISPQAERAGARTDWRALRGGCENTRGRDQCGQPRGEHMSVRYDPSNGRH